MRKHLLVVGLIALCSGGALGQEASHQMFVPHFEPRPANAPFHRYYPAALSTANRAGAALLCCDPDDSRKLVCRVATEFPESAGVGASALSILADTPPLTAESYAEYQHTRPGHIPVPIVFQMSGGPTAPALPADRWAVCNSASSG